MAVAAAPVRTDMGVLGSSEGSELNPQSDRSQGPGVVGDPCLSALPQVVLVPLDPALPVAC